MKKIASLATLLIAGTALTACGADTVDGTYTGTATNEGITFQVDMTVNGDVCQFSVTAPILGAVPYECQIDQSTNTIVLDGESWNYTVDGKNFILPEFEDEDVVLKKIG